ncbi:MAG: hypothetical protein QMB41_04445, partial [Rhodospirillales bacterium]
MPCLTIRTCTGGMAAIHVAHSIAVLTAPQSSATSSAKHQLRPCSEFSLSVNKINRLAMD